MMKVYGYRSLNGRSGRLVLGRHPAKDATGAVVSEVGAGGDLRMLFGLMEHRDGGPGKFAKGLLQDFRLALPATGVILQLVEGLGYSLDSINRLAHLSAPSASAGVLMFVNNITLHQLACLGLAVQRNRECDTISGDAGPASAPFGESVARLRVPR
jgi:hypothetical protein